jgi:hypothetical protein
MSPPVVVQLIAALNDLKNKILRMTVDLNEVKAERDRLKEQLRTLVQTPPSILKIRWMICRLLICRQYSQSDMDSAKSASRSEGYQQGKSAGDAEGYNRGKAEASSAIQATENVALHWRNMKIGDYIYMRMGGYRNWLDNLRNSNSEVAFIFDYTY